MSPGRPGVITPNSIGCEQNIRKVNGASEFDAVSYMSVKNLMPQLMQDGTAEDLKNELRSCLKENI